MLAAGAFLDSDRGAGPSSFVETSLRHSFRRIAQARSVEVEVRVGARDPDMGIAAVSTPFTRRALAENVDFQTLVLLLSVHDHLVHDTHLRE
jgi:hypothetical protein